MAPSLCGGAQVRRAQSRETVSRACSATVWVRWGLSARRRLSAGKAPKLFTVHCASTSGATARVSSTFAHNSANSTRQLLNCSLAHLPDCSTCHLCHRLEDSPPADCLRGRSGQLLNSRQPYGSAAGTQGGSLGGQKARRGQLVAGGSGACWRASWRV